MLSSRFAGIPISPSIIDEAGVPQVLACGDQTLRAENPAQVAGFISEWWPASNQNRGRIEIGISGRIESEFAHALAGDVSDVTHARSRKK
jgi:hypothetical protein